MATLAGIADLLRWEFTEEAVAGFPKLSRIPSSAVVKLIDYAEKLAPGDRDALCGVLARRGALRFFPPQVISAQAEEVRLDPVFQRYVSAMQSPEYGMGLRYCDLRTGRMMLSDPEGKAFRAAELAKLRLTPRDDAPESLVPAGDVSKAVPAKAPLLRKLTDQVFRERFASSKQRIPGGETGYTGSLEGTAFTVWVDFAAMGTQLKYGVSIPDETRNIFVSRLSWDDLWAAGSGWDYLTEENAQRSIELLCEQIAQLVRIRNIAIGL